MAGGAFLRRWFVEQNRFAFDLAHQVVAVGAFHIRVHALKRKSSTSIVIEQRRFPLRAIVALGAGCDIPLCELLAMRVLAALLALSRCGLEIHVDHVGFEVRRLMAVDAGGGAVCAQQRESSLRVIELG